eukprot:scaffold1507_cov158-Ochromonas_danica.AAC.1
MINPDFDPSVIASEAKAKVEKDPSSVEECRNVFLEQIFDWSDYYNESCSSDPEGVDSQAMAQSLVELWLAYADFEANLRQYKKAVDVYEKAMGDPIVGRVGRLYQAYADYCLARGRPGAAQKAYLSGLSTRDMPRKDSDTLWMMLLGLVQQVNKNATLTLSELRGLVAKQVTEGSQLAPLPSSSSDSNTTSSLTNDRQGGVDFASDNAAMMTLSASNVVVKEEEEAMVTYMDVAESKEEQWQPADNVVSTNSISLEKLLEEDNLDGVAGLTPEQIVRAYRLRPLMLFVAPHKEPLVSGLSALEEGEKAALEAFLQSPLSLKSEMLSARTNHILDVLEGLWYAQALKERHFDMWIVQMNELHKQQEAVASEGERKRLASRSAVQRELLHALINKTLFSLLIEQERVLAGLHFPRFNEVFTQTLESAARSHMTASSSSSAAASSLPMSFFDNMIAAELSQQRRLVCALLSLRLLAPISVPGPRLVRAMSTESDAADSLGGEDGNHDGKKLRKRRRSVLPQGYGFASGSVGGEEEDNRM